MLEKAEDRRIFTRGEIIKLNHAPAYLLQMGIRNGTLLEVTDTAFEFVDAKTLNGAHEFGLSLWRVDHLSPLEQLALEAE